MRSISRCVSAALLLSAMAGQAVRAESPNPKVREAFCQNNPDRCKEIKARRDAWCKEHKDDCTAMEARLEALKAQCEADPASCEKKSAPVHRPAPPASPPPAAPPPSTTPPPSVPGRSLPPANPNDV